MNSIVFFMFLIICTIGFTMVMVIISWIFARVWCKPKKFLPEKSPDVYQLHYEDVTFFSHGIELSGWFIHSLSSVENNPVVIIVHGWSNNSAKMLKIAKILNKANYNIFMFDFRGHGASGTDGPITILKFAEDIIASMDYLETRSGLETKRFALFGHSMGASGAILAASMDLRIGALISCSAFSSPHDITKIAMRKYHLHFWPFTTLVTYFIERWLGTSMRNVTPKTQIKNIRVPILLVHGDSDKYILPKNFDDLYYNANPKYREGLLLKNRNHFDIRNDLQFHKSIINFLNKNLSLN